MKRRILNLSSYEETKRNLFDYHKRVVAEVCREFNFLKVAQNPFIALRKNVELGFLCSPLLEWECEAVFKYGKKHVFHEYFPLIYDLVKQKVIPRKCNDYSCDITYFHVFPPQYHKDMLFACFVNFFEKPIFKNFNLHQSSLEQELVTKISTFLYKQNKFGPEKISVAILDDLFITIMISGFLPPYIKEYMNGNVQDALVIERIIAAQMEHLLEQIFNDHFDTKPYEPFIHVDRECDKIIILSSLSKDNWMKFLDKIKA